MESPKHKPRYGYCVICGLFQPFPLGGRCTGCGNTRETCEPEPKNRGFIVIDTSIDFQVEIQPERHIIAIFFLKENQGISYSLPKFDAVCARVRSAMDRYNGNRDMALDFARIMLNPENQPPQFSKEQIWEKFKEIMALGVAK